jgi:hypothetical protein
VERSALFFGGGGGVEVGPEKIHDLLAGEVLRGAQGEEFHQAARLPQSPGAVGDRLVPDSDLEGPEQADL